MKKTVPKCLLMLVALAVDYALDSWLINNPREDPFVKVLLCLLFLAFILKKNESVSRRRVLRSDLFWGMAGGQATVYGYFLLAGSCFMVAPKLDPFLIEGPSRMVAVAFFIAYVAGLIDWFLLRAKAITWPRLPT